jgi:GxxExxY protein
MDHVREGYRDSRLTDTIICCFYTVYNSLGSGFLEKVYKNALFLELQHRKLCAEKEKEILVYYRGALVGAHYADLLVEDKIILELKAVSFLVPEHEAQLLSYLRATEIEVGLLFNFGPKPEVRRKVYENHRKDSFPPKS